MEDFWQETAAMFSSLISKPKMTEKLLKKPPFRFIHDTIMATMGATGYPQGLYTEQELDSKTVSDKESKIVFLQKTIDHVSQTIGETVDCKPNKIVAGQEAEKTNSFLQALFRAATGQFEQKQPKEERKDDRKEEKKKRKKEEEKAKEQQRLEQQRLEEEKRRQEEAKKTEEKEKKRKVREEAKKTEEKPKREEKKKPKEDKKPKEEPKPQEEKTKKLERPTTAGRRPPKIKQAQVEETKQAAPAGVILEGNQDDDEDELIAQTSTAAKKGVAAQQVKQEEHGKLVRDILQDDQGPKHVPMEHEPDDTGLGAPEGKKIKLSRVRGNKETSKKAPPVDIGDIETLKTNIQGLCQSANPLGKSLEFVNDDVENMKREHNKWQSQFEQGLTQMEDQKRLTEEHLQPYYDKLAEIEEQIKEKQLKINHTKAKILKNESTIKGLLQGVVSVK